MSPPRASSVVLLLLLGCPLPPPAGNTSDEQSSCGEKGIDAYERCMSIIGTEDSGCQEMAREVVADCRAERQVTSG